MRRKIVIILSICSLFLTACGKDAERIVESEQSQKNIISCDRNIYFTSHSNIAVSPNGYYVLNHDQEFYLTYIDGQSGEEIYLCGKPECSHVDENGKHILETCDAYVGDFLGAIPNFLFYYEEYLYLLGYNSLNYDVMLKRVSQDGSIHEDMVVVGQSPDCATYFEGIIANGVLYLAYNEPNYDNSEKTVNLEKIDLETKESSVVYSCTGKTVGIGFLKRIGNSLYFAQSGREDGDDFYHYLLMEYHMVTGETESVLDENIGFYTFSGENTIFYTIPFEGLYRYDLISGERQLIMESDEEMIRIQLACDGTYLYLNNSLNYNYNDGEYICKIIVCTLEGEIVNEILVDKQEIVELVDDNYMLKRYYSDEGFSRIQRVSREDITSENVVWELVERHGN